jgi:hypothetical protein
VWTQFGPRELIKGAQLVKRKNGLGRPTFLPNLGIIGARKELKGGGGYRSTHTHELPVSLSFSPPSPSLVLSALSLYKIAALSLFSTVVAALSSLSLSVSNRTQGRIRSTLHRKQKKGKVRSILLHHKGNPRSIVLPLCSSVHEIRGNTK